VQRNPLAAFVVPVYLVRPVDDDHSLHTLFFLSAIHPPAGLPSDKSYDKLLGLPDTLTPLRPSWPGTEVGNSPLAFPLRTTPQFYGGNIKVVQLAMCFLLGPRI